MSGYAIPPSDLAGSPALTPLNPVLAQPQANDMRQTCSGLDYWPSYEGIMQSSPGPAAPPFRSRDGGSYNDGSWYNDSGFCYSQKSPPVVFPRNFVTSTGVPLASAGGKCMLPKSGNFAACQNSSVGGWWPTNYNGGVLIRPSQPLAPPCSWVFNNVAPWGLKQR